LDRVQQVAPTARGPRLLMRLGLFAFCAGLLLLLSSRPADAAERREPQLLDPVGTTLKATAREVDSFAGRATGSGSSTVARTVDAARQAVAPPPRPTPGAARSPVAATVKRGAPAFTSPVRRVAPPTASSPHQPGRRPGSPRPPPRRWSGSPGSRVGRRIGSPRFAGVGLWMTAGTSRPGALRSPTGGLSTEPVRWRAPASWRRSSV
jgi:hypothetical protein